MQPPQKYVFTQVYHTEASTIVVVVPPPLVSQSKDKKRYLQVSRKRYNKLPLAHLLFLQLMY